MSILKSDFTTKNCSTNIHGIHLSQMFATQTANRHQRGKSHFAAKFLNNFIIVKVRLSGQFGPKKVKITVFVAMGSDFNDLEYKMNFSAG